MLYDEVEFILREELREPRYYFALLQAISQGKRKLSEIVNTTGLRQPVANKYLGVLSDLKVVERELPVTVEKPLKSKEGLYRIIEEFFQFWFKFIFAGRGELEMGKADIVIDRMREELNKHLSMAYEKVAREVIWNHLDKFDWRDHYGNDTCHGYCPKSSRTRKVMGRTVSCRYGCSRLPCTGEALTCDWA